MLRIKKGSNPEKVIDEGDTLGLNIPIHSFFWSFDGISPKPDYEPVAFNKNTNLCLSRFHYKCLTIWKDCNQIKGVPIVTFLNLYHTPLLCTSQRIFFTTPTDDTDRILLFGMLRFLKAMKLTGQLNFGKTYETSSYSLEHETIPDKSKFSFGVFTYCILFAPTLDIDRLDLPNKLKLELMKIKKLGRKDLIEF